MQDLPRGQRARSPETWERARADYLSGLSAAQVCERWDLTESALRKRADREGWRRCDQPEPEPPPALNAPFDPDRAPTPAAELLRRARLGLEDALAAGRVLEARHWLRVHADLTTLARAEAPPEPGWEALTALNAYQNAQLAEGFRRELAELQAAAAEAVTAQPDPDPDADGYDVSHVPPKNGSAPAAAPLNRHDRRRRARLAAWKARQEGRGKPQEG